MKSLIEGLHENMKKAIDQARSRLSCLQVILDTMEKNENNDFINVVGSLDYRRVVEQINSERELMSTANKFLISLMGWE
jgi:predicted transcriptional regulator